MKDSQAHREQAKTENDSAFEGLRAAMARLDESIEQRYKDFVQCMVVMAVGIVVVLGGLIAIVWLPK